MTYSIVGSIVGGVASAVGTVMSPICELWHQQGITETAIACQAINATCWKSGYLVNSSGIVSRLVTIITPTVVGSTAVCIGNKLPDCVDLNDKAFCCKEIARITAIVGSIVILGVGSAVTLTYTDNAEIAAYSLGQCLSSSIVNTSSCEILVDTMQSNNIAAGIAWGVVNLAAATCGLLVGNCCLARTTTPVANLS